MDVPEAPAPRGSFAKKFFLFILSSTLITAVISFDSIIGRLKGLDLAGILNAGANRQAAAPQGPSEAQVRAVEAFQTNAQMAYQALAKNDAENAARYADAALAVYDKALHGAAQGPAILMMRARANELLGKKEQALADYEAATEGEAKVEALAGKARIQLAAGDAPAAIAEAKRMIQAAPDRPEGHVAEAEAQGRVGDAAAAEAAFTRAAETAEKAGWRTAHPKQLAALYFNRAVMLANLKKPGDAIKDASRAIALDPEEGHYFEARGRLYAATGQEGLAESDFRKARTAAPALNLSLGAAPAGKVLGR